MLMERSERNAARAEWLEARRAGIGSSDAPVILGLSKHKSLLHLYAEKRGLRTIGEQERDWLEWGHRLEPVVAAKYEEETGRDTYDPGDFHIERHHAEAWMIATPDRIIVDYPLPPPSVLPSHVQQASHIPGVLELKTASAWNKKEWKDEPPLAYQVQLQHQLAVTGHLWGSIAVLIGGQTFLWMDVPRNEDFIARLMKQEHAFFECVQRGEAPEPDGSIDAANALAAIYPVEELDAIELPMQAVKWDKERAQSIEVIKVHEDIKRECENRIKAAIGNHAVGLIPHAGARYAWRTVARKGYVVEAGSSRQLRRAETQV